jgi:signal transduction histidine kinase
VALGLRRAFVRVTDTGAGIPQEMLQSAFEPAPQYDDRTGDSRSGTGLGLSVSLRLARLMAGDLVAESEVGKGSRFTLWLPTPSATTN